MGPTGGADIAGALLANALKAKAEGRKPTLQTLICGMSAYPSSCYFDWLLTYIESIPRT